MRTKPHELPDDATGLGQRLRRKIESAAAEGSSVTRSAFDGYFAPFEGSASDTRPATFILTPSTLGGLQGKRLRDATLPPPRIRGLLRLNEQGLGRGMDGQLAAWRRRA
jgi:hypothetical protein